MTHDKLLAKINSATCCSGIHEVALRAVVELHKPFIWEGKETKFCNGCQQCWGCGEWGGSDDCPCDKYPCKTIQIIVKELQ